MKDMSTSESTGSSLFWNDLLAKDLQRFLTGRLKCSETAADLTHETYLRLEQRIKDNPPDNARALAFRIALNLAIDYQRKVSVRNRYASNTPYDAALEIASNQSSQPDRKLIAQQQLDAMKKALDELPVNCRSAFYMQSVEGLKYAEIAERLGVSKSMVNKLLSQAMAHCAQRIEK